MTGPSQPATAVRVLIVEDHPVVAEGLSALLEEYPGMTVAGCARSVSEVIPAIEESPADVAIVDYRLPDGTGIDAAERIRAQSPATAIVFLSADYSDERLVTAIEAGARGYLIKSATGEEIVAAIRSAAQDETLIPGSTIADVLARRRESSRQRSEQAERLRSLTPREREILMLMAQGLDNRAVAERLSIGYATVRTHVRSVLRKLGAQSQLEAVAKATQWGFRG